MLNQIPLVILLLVTVILVLMFILYIRMLYLIMLMSFVLYNDVRVYFDAAHGMWLSDVAVKAAVVIKEVFI